MREDLRSFTLAVSRAVGIGPRTFSELCESCGGIAEVDKLFKAGELPEKLQTAIAESAAQDWQHQLSQFDLNYICVWEQDYPTALKQIADPPIILFYKGDWRPELFSQMVSVVGTRAATSQGKVWTETLATELAASGIAIVSGMAFGIDSAAHMAAIKANGLTVAVLAGSAHEASPARNKYVYDAILAHGGVILSETFPGDELVPGMFARRNRIVAGLSLGTLVMEADIKSGALITAELALGYGRQVWAVPGEPNRQMSRGCNQLIRQSKATLVESGADILVELGLTKGLIPEAIPAVPEPNKMVNIDPSARIIYTSLQKQGRYLEQICADTTQTTAEILSILTSLQVQGLVMQTEIGEYRAV